MPTYDVRLRSSNSAIKLGIDVLFPEETSKLIFKVCRKALRQQRGSRLPGKASAYNQMLSKEIALKCPPELRDSYQGDQESEKSKR